MTLEPVPPAARIPTLDILRGFALFGVLLSNLNGDYGAPNWSLIPYFPITLEGSLSWIQRWLVQDRFYTLLAFLFGIGFGIQLRRAEAVGGNARILFCRRMLALLAFGVIHGMLIWSGDILTTYALVGFLLVPYAALSPRRLPAAAAATYFLLPCLTRLIAAALSVDPSPTRLPDVAQIYAHGTFAQIATLRLHQYLASFSYPFYQGFAVSLTLFVLGLWAERISLASNLSTYIGRIRRALWIALLCAALGLVITQIQKQWWPQPATATRYTSWLDPGLWSIRGVIRGTASILFKFGTAASYAAALTLLVQRSRWERKLTPLAAVGRMPLTSYLMQSLMCTTLFYSYGFGWYGRFSIPGMFLIAVTMFAIQIVASNCWLRHFRLGPAEWLWRSLSYGRAQPIRLALPQPRVGSV